jgi:muconate cycloisomerase
VLPVSTPASAQRGQIAGIFYKDDIIAAPMQLQDGAVRLPAGPGLGIDVDPAKIEQYRVED